jgi:hypothetical protein
LITLSNNYFTMNVYECFKISLNADLLLIMLLGVD